MMIVSTRHNLPRFLTILAAAGLVVGMSPLPLLGESADSSTPRVGPIHETYLPIEDLDVLLQRDQRGVLLPRGEFLDLYRKARENADRTRKTPVPVVLHSAAYTARVIDSQLVLDAELELMQLSDGWQSLSLPFRNLTVERATVDGKPARLGLECTDDEKTETAGLVLLNDRPGRFRLELELSTPLAAAGSDQVAALGLAPSPSATLAVHLPAGKHLHVNDVLLERPAPTEEETVYEIPAGGKTELVLRITDRQRERTTDSLVFATTRLDVDVAPGEATWRASTTLQVFGEEINRLHCLVPRTLEIAEIESTGLESWELTDAPDDPTRTLITLTFRQPFHGGRSIRLTGVMAAGAGEPWTLPTLVIRNVTSHVGEILLRHPAGVRVRVDETTNVRRTAVAANRPRAGAASPQLRFDFWREDFVLRLTTLERERELQAALSTILQIQSDGMELQFSGTLETFFAPLFEVDLALPAEWSITNVTLGERPVTWQLLPAEAGTHQVRIPLETPLSPGSEMSLVLSARRDLEDGSLDEAPLVFNLPEVRLPQASVVEGVYAIKAEDELDVSPVEITGLDPARLGIEGERFGYTYQDTRFSGQFRAVREAASVAVRTLSFTRLDERTLFSHLEARLNIDGGGLRTFQVVLSESAGTDLRFELLRSLNDDSSGGLEWVRIVEQQPSDPQNGERVWTLRLDRRIRGEAFLSVDVTSPRGEQQTFEPHTLRIVEAERTNGYIALEAAGDQRLVLSATDANGQPLQEVDPIDLPTTDSYTPKERIVAAYRYVTPGYRVTFSSERFDRGAVPTAICHECQLTSILGQTGEFQHRAAFTLTAVGIQSLRLQLPVDEARADTNQPALWAVLVDGRPVEVRTSEAAFWIPLPDGNDSTGRRRLEVFYRTRVEPLTDFGRWQEHPPQLAAVNGEGVVQPLQVLQQTWDVSYPEETLLVDSDGNFQPVDHLDQPGFLGRFRNEFRIPSTERLLWNAVYVLLAAGMILLLTLAFRRFGIWGLIAAVGVAAVILVGFLISQSRSARVTVADGRATSGTEASRSAPTMGGESAAAEQRTTDDLQQVPEANQPARGRDRADGDFAMEEAEPEAQPEPPQRPRPPLEGQIAQQAPPQQAFPEQVAPADPAGERQRIMGIERGGLLSLTLELKPPADNRMQSFKYYGTRNAAGGVGLNVAYENRMAVDTLRNFLIVAIALLFWWLRQASKTVRAVLAFAGIAVPLALITIVPVTWHVYLDGIFFGALAGIALWILRIAAQSTAALIPRGIRRQRATVERAALLILTAGAVSISTSSTTHAARPPQPRGKASVHSSTTGERPATEVRRSGVHEEQEADGTPRLPVFIPYDPANDPQAAERVFLPHDEFLKLWNLAHPDRKQRAPAPAEGFVAEALYSAELAASRDVRRGRVSITGRLVLYSFRDQPITLPIPLGQVALSEARLNGERAAIITPKSNNDSLSVVIENHGQHVLDVQFDVPAELSGPAGQFTLPLKTVPAGRLTFELPADDLTVRVNGASNAFRMTTPNDAPPDAAPSVEIPIARGGDLTVAWRPRQEAGPTSTIIHTESETAARIDEAGIRLSSGWELRIPRGNLSEIDFDFPAALKLKSLSGADVGGWQINGEGDERTIRVFFRRAVGDQTQLVFDLYVDDQLGTETTTIDVPTMAPRQVARDTGRLGIFVGDRLSVRRGDVTGLTQINANQFATSLLPQPPKRTPELAFRYTSRPIDLTLQVSRRLSESRVSAEHGVLVDPRKIRFATRLRYVLTQAPRATVSVRLPEGFLPIHVAATDLADWYVTPGAPGGDVLTIEFAEPRIGRAEVALRGTIPKNPDDAAISITVPQPLDIQRLESALAVWLNEVYSGTLGNFENWRSVDPESLPETVRRLQNRPVQFGFTSTAGEPSAIAMTLDRAEPRLAADALAMITVTDTLVDYALGLNWRISQAAADTFTVTLPRWMGDDVDFEGAGIRQVSPTEVAPDGTRWTITLQEPIRERYFVLARATLPPAATEVRSPEIVFEQQPSGAPNGEYRPLPTQQKFVLLINQSPAQLDIVNPEVAESVEPVQVPITIGRDLLDQATQLLRLRENALAPVWRVRRFEQQQGPAASVNVADWTLVLSQDGTWRGQALYTIRNRARQFLALRIPEAARILSVFVKDQPARPVDTQIGGTPAVLIALPKTSASDLSFQVQLVLEGRLDGGPLPEGFSTLPEEYDLPTPEVIPPDENAAYGIPVAQTLWTVYAPEDLVIEPIDDPDRNNLSQVESQDAQLAYEINRYKEALELLQVFEGAFSNVQRARAISNLQQVESAQTSGAEALRESEQLQELQESYRRKRQEKAAWFDQETRPADGRAVTFDEAQQQSQIVENARSLLENNAPPTADANGRLSSRESLEQWEIEVPEFDDARQKSEVSIRQDALQDRTWRRQQALENTQRLNEQLGAAKAPTKPSPSRSERDAAPRPTRAVEGRAAFPAGHDEAAVGLGGAAGIGGGFVPGAVAGESAVWSSVGGLSLAMDVPENGQRLTFSKVSGNPKLALAIRPRESFEIGFGLVWTIAILALGLLAVILLARAGAAVALTRVLPGMLIVLGLAGIFMLPLFLPGMLLFVIGLLLVALSYRHAPQ